MQTFIIGKDEALENTLQHFQTSLTQGGFKINEVSWLNPVPNVYSVHIHEQNCPQCFANGKGALQKSTLASALGEFIERLSTNYFFNDYYLGKELSQAKFVHYPNEKWFAFDYENENAEIPAGLLTPDLWQFYDPNQALTPDLLVDLQSSNLERGIVALPFKRQRDGETVYFPVNILSNLYVSNGMSAGNTFAEAHVQALSEIFERHVKNRVLQEALSLPEIPAEIVAMYPKVQEAIAHIEQAGFPIVAFDASLGGQYPVICVVLFNPNNGTCFASFGSHPNFNVALERTVTELLQGRSLKDLTSFSEPSFDNEEVSDLANLESHFIDSNGVISWDLFKQTPDFEFSHWNFSNSTNTGKISTNSEALETEVDKNLAQTEQEFANLCEILHRQNKDIYIMDYDHLKVTACRIIVPSVSEIYPVDDLIYANNNSGMQWREILLDLPNFHHDGKTYAELLSELDEQGIDDQTLVREFLGLLCEKNSHWYYLRIGELKALLYLALRDFDNAREWVEWTISMNSGNFPVDTLNYYKALLQSLDLFMNFECNRQEYFSAFAKLYGQERVELIWQILEGGNPFHMLVASDEDLSNFTAHQRLIATYHKLQKLKVSA